MCWTYCKIIGISSHFQ